MQSLGRVVFDDRHTGHLFYTQSLKEVIAHLSRAELAYTPEGLGASPKLLYGVGRGVQRFESVAMFDGVGNFCQLVVGHVKLLQHFELE